MQKYFLFIVLLCLYGCKTRQVDIAATNITDRSARTQITKSNTSSTDTGKTSTYAVSKHVSNDSIEIEITPDTGIVKITNGNYIGKARNIIIKKKSANLQLKAQLVQQNHAQTIQSTVNDSVITSNNIITQLKTKQVTAKGLNIQWYWFLGLFVLAALCFLVFKHLI